MRQLYKTVAMPTPTYASDIQYIPPFKTAQSPKPCGSVKDTTTMFDTRHSNQYITGGIKGTAFDVLKAHINIPLIYLTCRIAQFHAASRISTLLCSTH